MQHMDLQEISAVSATASLPLALGQKKGKLVKWVDKLHSQEISSLSVLKQEKTIARGEERRGERRTTLREAKQPVSNTPLLLGELRTWVNFLALPHCWHIWPVQH